MKIIFHMHVTFDLWWLYINMDLWYYHISILIKINYCFINHLLTDIYPYAICTPPCCGKSAGKNTEMNKTSNFLFGIYYFIYFLTQNNHQLNFLVHQYGENAKSKWSLFRQNDVTRKWMFCLYFPNPTLFFSFSFANINDNILIRTEFCQNILSENVFSELGSIGTFQTNCFFPINFMAGVC